MRTDFSLEVMAAASGGGFCTTETLVDIADLIPAKALGAIRARVGAVCEQVDARRREQEDVDRGAYEGDLPPFVPSRAGFVYLMRSGGLHKIGVTASKVESRRRQIQQASGRPVEIVASWMMSDARASERAWHEYFSHARREGEWFELSADDVRAMLSGMGGNP